MKHVMSVIFSLFVMMLNSGIAGAAETDVKDGKDHPLISRMPGFYISGYSTVELGNSKFIDQAKKQVTIEGKKTYIEYRLMSNAAAPGELKIRRSIQENTKGVGGNLIFDDNFNRCSTIIFQNGGMETWVDVRAFDKMYRLTIVEKAGAGPASAITPERPAKTIDPALSPGQALPSQEKLPKTQNLWPEWIKSAKKSVRSGFPQWSNMLRLNDGVVNGGTVTEGFLSGPSVLLLISPSMMTDGVPNSIINGLMKPVDQAVSFWASSVRVPNLLWYPSFLVVPSPIAPPTKSIPARLADLIQLKTFLEPSMLTMKIKSELGKDGETPEAEAAIKEFCDWFYSGFSSWLLTATIKEVIGTGPVPAFNPGQNVFSGPVVNGTANGGVISPSPSWLNP